MILPKREDAIHKGQMYRLISEIIDSSVSQNVYFKGGTCAAMLDFLDRFSIDLDFDIKKKADKKNINKQLKKIFKKLDLELKQKSKNTLFYLLKYNSREGERNTIKLSLADQALKSNIYQPFYLKDIDRFCICQTKETMFANKLVAVIDRYKKGQTIAGRDIYDIHYFFLQGACYVNEIITERTGKKPIMYLKELINFIDEKINDTALTQDLSFLLPYNQFKLIRKVLKKETLIFLKDEVKRLSNKS